MAKPPVLQFFANAKSNSPAWQVFLARHKQALAAFAFVFLLYLVYLPTTTYDFLPRDSGKYWWLAKLFLKSGSFSLTSFNDNVRGYLYPLLNLPVYLLWQKTGLELFVFVKIMGCLTAALLFGIVMPALWQVLWKTAEITLWQRIFFALLGFLFWRDYFSFTLSDFPAVLAFMAGVGLLFRSRNFVGFVLVGILLGAAFNIRPLYLISVPFILLAIFTTRKENRKGIYLFRVLSVFIGFLLISLPQILINYKNQQVLSPLVVSKIGDKKPRNLFLQQLEWGIEIEKYETSLDLAYPALQMVYLDPLGQKLLKENELPSKWNTQTGKLLNLEDAELFQGFGQYFALVFSDPLAFGFIYLKHLFNGLDIQFPTPYIQNVAEVNYFLMLVNYSVFFAAAFIFRYKLLPVLNGRQFLVLAILVTPAILAIPIAIECRYLLPLHLLAYAIVAFAWPKGWWGNLSVKQRGALVAGYLIFVGSCFFASYQLQQHLIFQPRYIF